MRAMFAILRRDLVLGLRQGGDILTLLLFFVSVGVLVPFAVGPDRPLLAVLAPAVVWIAALLAQLVSHERLFRADAEDGALALFRQAVIPLEMVVMAQILAHWLLTALPLVLAAPLLALMLGMDGAALLRTLVALLIGTPALVALGAIGAGLTVGLKRGGLVAPVLVLPLCLPVLIFGTGAVAEILPELRQQALLFLGAFSLISVTLAPFAVAQALKISGE